MNKRLWKIGQRVAIRCVGVAAMIGITALACTSLWCAGCSDPLLSPKDERTPFDRYDAVRNQHAPQYVEDKFGRRKPNLEGRLRPRD